MSVRKRFADLEHIIAGEEATGRRSYSDDAKRAADTVNELLTHRPGAVQRWVAIKLADGSSDGVLYDSKRDAVRHQSDEYHCFYICIPPTGTSPAQMQVMLDMHRAMYKAGMRMVDPDDSTGGPQWVKPTMLEDLHSQQRRLGILRNSRLWNGN